MNSKITDPCMTLIRPFEVLVCCTRLEKLTLYLFTSRPACFTQMTSASAKLCILCKNEVEEVEIKTSKLFYWIVKNQNYTKTWKNKDSLEPIHVDNSCRKTFTGPRHLKKKQVSDKW